MDLIASLRNAVTTCLGCGAVYVDEASDSFSDESNPLPGRYTCETCSACQPDLNAGLAGGILTTRRRTGRPR